MTDLFVRELTEGFAGTGIKAAFLCVIEDELTPQASSGSCAP
ncbi:hypothetical protein ACIOHS_47590 [Streptomyces sp. NPDC088253]